MRFYINERDVFALEIERDKEVIADFLGADVQGSKTTVDYELKKYHAVINGEIPEWEGTGNAHTVTIKPDGVELYNEFTDESIRLSLEEFEWYLKQWERLLTTCEEFTIESPFK